MPGGQARLKGVRVLIVEDDFFVADFTQSLLEELGCAVIGPAGSQSDALALIEGEEPDLAVLDVNLEGEDVGVVAEALRTRSIPFIFQTGYEPRQISGRTSEPVVQKPFSTIELRDALIESLEQARR